MKFTQSEVAGLYSQGNAHGASPLGLVVALYDTILRDLSRAGDAIAQDNVEKRTFELNHALRVIAELENVLDFEQGGEAAKRLKNFYIVTRGMILDASIKNSREAIGKLWDIFATVRKAWNEAEQKIKNGGGPGSYVSPASEAAIPAASNSSQQSRPIPALVTQRQVGAGPAGVAATETAPRGNWSA